MRALALLVFLGLSFAFDIKNPQGEPANQGRQIGNQFRDIYGGGNKGENLRLKLLEPALSNSPDTRYTLPKKGGGEQTLVGRPVFCGYGNPKEEKVFARVRLNANTVNFYYASDPYTGVLDRAISYSGRFLCPKGFCSNFSIVGGEYKYTGCQEVYLDRGVFKLRPVNSLDNCVDVNRMPQQASFFASYVQELIQYYHSIGKPIIQSKVEEPDLFSADFYGGRLECSGVQRNLPQTQYYKNPYVLRDHALYYYLTCDINDPSCKAVKSFMSMGEDRARNICRIYRSVNTNTLERTDGRICVPGARLYAVGYNESNSICRSGSDFFMDFSSSFWLECNADGKGYTLKGWAYWEGAPCGRADFYPPLPQVEVVYPFGQIVNQVEVGRLSVNKRISDDGGACVSDLTPYRVRISNTLNGRENVLTVNVENVPACGQWIFKVSPLVGEVIISECDDYEKRGCRVINEWWLDVVQNRYQVIKEGKLVNQMSGCLEIVRDEERKDWTSIPVIMEQVKQAPPQNCNYPPKTCKNLGGRVECRQWWTIEREYECVNLDQGQTRKPSLEGLREVFFSIDYNPQSGNLSWGGQSRYIGTALGGWEESESCLSVEARYCLVRKASTGGRNANEYEVKECLRDGVNWVCPLSHGERMIEGCKCAKNMTMGFGLATSAISILNNALKDSVCVGGN